MKLDEAERSSTTRLMKVKDMMVEKQMEAERAEDDSFECSECGAEIPEDAKVCPKCGAVFDEEEEIVYVEAEKKEEEKKE